MSYIMYKIVYSVLLPVLVALHFELDLKALEWFKKQIARRRNR